MPPSFRATWGLAFATMITYTVSIIDLLLLAEFAEADTMPSIRSPQQMA